MKQNRIFDQNSSQKARSWHYNMDTNRAEAQFADGSAIAIDCLAIEGRTACARPGLFSPCAPDCGLSFPCA